MSDDRFGVQRTTGSSDGPVTQAEIDDVLNDPRLSPQERHVRLGDLRQRLLDDRHADGSDEFEPLSAQIADAFSMLAEGGHDYDGSLRVEGQGAGGQSDTADEELTRDPERRDG